MREVLFKGIRVKTGKWVYGFLMSNDEILENLETTAIVGYTIDPSTVCQFTGLLDSKGVKIFEFDEITDDDGEPYAAIFKDGKFVLQHEDGCFSLDQFRENITVTGNVFEPINDKDSK